MFCTKCGMNIAETSKFCPKCGLPVKPIGTAPASAPAYGAPPQSEYSPSSEAPVYAAPYPPADTPRGGTQAYVEPRLPTSPSVGVGKSKRKGRIWIPLAAGIIVLALAFGALSLFTNVFPWSNKSAEDTVAVSTRRRFEDNEDVEANTPRESPAESMPEIGALPTESAPASETTPAVAEEPDETLDGDMQWEGRKFEIYEIRDDNPWFGSSGEADGRYVKIVFQLDGNGNYGFFFEVPFFLIDIDGNEFSLAGSIGIDSGAGRYSRKFDVPEDIPVEDLILGFDDEYFKLKNYLAFLVS